MNHAKLFSILLTIALAAMTSTTSAQSQRKPGPRLIQLDPTAVDSMDIFTGPPGTVTMRSGYMVLAPGKSVGRHSTKRNEEALIVLSGSGEMRIVNGSTIRLSPYCVAYCPPATEHDVFNTGQDTLRYIWLVAQAMR
jgi:mannose-6-phosphate isomerase-like protein (cupin superfamily)